MSLEKIYDLKPEESRLVYSELDGGQRIEVREWEQYRWLHIDGDSVQALLNMNAIEHIALPNIKALLTAFVIYPSARRLLNLGLGGASLERYLASRWPEIEMRTVESNEQVIQLAKDYFYLPEQAEVIHDSAEGYLSKHNDVYDIILCDIFAEEKQPDCLYNDDFYASIRKCLTKPGVLAMNLLPDSEEDVVEVLMPMKNHFDHISLYEVPNHLNAVIFASCHRLPETNALRTVANELFEKTELDLRDIPERLNRLLETIDE